MRKTVGLCCSVSTWFLVLVSCACAQTDNQFGTYTVKQEVILSLEKGERGLRGGFSSDGSKFGMAVEKGKESYLWCDGVEGRFYTVVFPPVFSRDGSRMAYLALKENCMVVVIDGREIGPLSQFKNDDVRNELVFSRDAKHFAFRAKSGTFDNSEGCFVYHDGVVEHHESIVGPPPSFSPDGDRLVYFVRDKSDWCAVIDGVAGKALARTADGPGFSADGTRFCYKGYDKDSLIYIVVDDTVYGPYWRNLAIGFSPVGSDLAWSASADSLSQDTLYVNGIGRIAHDRIWNIFYSNDGNRLAYIAKDADSFSLYLDSFVSPGYQDITGVWYSPEGTHFAYIACPWPKGSEQLLMQDSQLVCSYPEFSLVRYSPDGTRLAAAVRLRSGKMSVVEGGSVGPPLDSICLVRFSPDSRSLYYLGTRGKKYVVVQDGVEGRPYARINDGIVVDSISNRLIYLAAEKENEAIFVIDGHETDKFDYPFGITRSVSTNGTVVAYAERDGKVYRLTISRSLPPRTK